MRPSALRKKIDQLDSQQRGQLVQALLIASEASQARVREISTASTRASDPGSSAYDAARYYEFDISLSSVISGPARSRPFSNILNWSNDGCSTPVLVTRLTFSYWLEFQKSCVRHDFGYRNFVPRSYAKVGSANYPWYRDRIDDKFHADMLESCASWDLPCKTVAYAYYRAVSNQGGQYF